MAFTSLPKMILLLLVLVASLCATAFPVETPASTFDGSRLSKYANALTEEQLLNGFQLIKDLLPPDLDPKAVINSIKTGSEMELTSSQVQAMQATRRSNVPRDTSDPCVSDVIAVCVDAVGILGGLFGISTRAGSIANSIHLSPEEARSLRGLIQTIGSSAASAFERASGLWSLISGLINIFSVTTLINWMTQGLSYADYIKASVTAAAQLAIWFGTDGLGFIGEVAFIILANVNLVQDCLAATRDCGTAPTPATIASARLTVAANAGGGLEVFIIDEKLVPHHTWVNPDGSWSPVENLSDRLFSRISVARNLEGRLEAFGLGTDQAIWHTWQDSSSPSGWANWQSLGGWSSELAVGINPDGRLEVFAIGSSNRPYHIWQNAPNSGWSSWDTLSTTISLKELSVARNQNGALQVFGLGTDQAVYSTHQGPNGWNTWQAFGGWVSTLTSSINADGRLEVFAAGGGNTAYHTWQNAPNSDSWSNWNYLNSNQVQQLAAAQLSGGQVIVFGINTDQTVSFTVQDPNGAGGWSNWVNLGGSMTQLSLVIDKFQALQVFAISSDKNIYVSKQLAVFDPQSWSDWIPLN